MTHLAAKLALFVLVITHLGCDKQEPAAATDAGAPAAVAAPAATAATDNDPFAEIPTEADYEEQADLAIDKNNFVDRLDEIAKEIDAPDPG